MPMITTRVRGIRKDIESRFLSNFDFQVGDVLGCIVHIFSDEDITFKAGELRPMKIEPVKIKANTLISISPYARHGVGHIIAVGEKEPSIIEKDRLVDRALFAAGVEGDIVKGELVGVLETFPIKPMK